MWELVFTSAKAGLIPGRSGFCSVAWTAGMPQNLVALLENMSGYNALYMPDDPKANLNPVCYSYQKVRSGQKELRVLSRIAFAGLDYTGRTNKIAHHIVIEDDSELMNLPHGPVSAFLNEENFITEWNEPPQLLDPGKRLIPMETPGYSADRWRVLAGDPQWAGIIADSFMESDEKSCLYLEYDNEAHRDDVLYLVDEIARLLPEDKVDDFTFTTCFSNAQSGVNCFFRAALPNCPALPAIKRFKAKDLVSLINPAPAPQGYSASPSVVAAITGNAPVRTIAMPVEMGDGANLQQSETAMTQGSPPSSSAADTKRREQERRLASGNMSPRMRLTLFALGTLMLLVLIGVGAWVTVEMMKTDEVPVSQEKKKEPTALETNIEPENKEKAAADQGEAPQADKPQTTPQEKSAADEKKEPAQQVADSDAAEKDAAAKERAAKEGVAKAAAKELENAKLQLSYELFKGYVAIGDGQRELLLPEKLKDAVKIEVELRPRWSGNNEAYKFSEDGEYYAVTDTTFKIHPLDEETKLDDKQRMDESKVFLAIELKENKLVFGGNGLDDILEAILGSTITFTMPNGATFPWTICFNAKFLEDKNMIPLGVFDDQDTYQPSTEEAFWKSKAYIRIDDGDLKSKIDSMDRDNEKYEETEAKIKQLKNVKMLRVASAKEVEVAWKALQKALNTERKKKQDARSTTPVKKAFDAFYNVLLYADENATKKAVKIYVGVILTPKLKAKEKEKDKKEREKKDIVESQSSRVERIEDEIKALKADIKAFKEEKKKLSNDEVTEDQKTEAVNKLLEHIDEKWRNVFGQQGGGDSKDFISVRKKCNSFEEALKGIAEQKKKYSELARLQEYLGKLSKHTEADFKKKREEALKNIKRTPTGKGLVR